MKKFKQTVQPNHLWYNTLFYTDEFYILLKILIMIIFDSLEISYVLTQVPSDIYTIQSHTY